MKVREMLVLGCLYRQEVGSLSILLHAFFLLGLTRHQLHRSIEFLKEMQYGDSKRKLCFYIM
jgi:hypothetical protein